ncbi:hypothetical protein N0V87_010699, partial [Didymella glomerata]
FRNLLNVIDSATPHRLRTLLKEWSTTTPAIFGHVQDELMLPSGALKMAWSERGQDEDGNNEDDDGIDEQDEEGEDDSDDTSEDAGYDFESDYSDEQTDAPAIRQRYEICVQCHEEYDVLLNDKTSCEWHDGEPHTPGSTKAYVECDQLTTPRRTRGGLGRRLLG